MRAAIVVADHRCLPVCVQPGVSGLPEMAINSPIAVADLTANAIYI
jgi:hypothetical protein